MKPLSRRVFDVLTFMDCHPPVSIGGAVNGTAEDAGRDVFEAIAAHLGLPFEDSPTGAADAVHAWEDSASGWETRAALTACGWAERRKERDAEDNEQVTRDLQVAARKSPEEIRAELAQWEERRGATPDRHQLRYEEGLRKLLQPVPVDQADEDGDVGDGADFFRCHHARTSDPGHDRAVCERMSEEEMQQIMAGTDARVFKKAAPVKTVTINWIPAADTAGPLYVIAHKVNGELTTTRYIRPDCIDAERADLIEDGWTITADERPGGAL